MALKKVINSATQQFEPVLVDKLVLDAVPTVNSFNSVTSDAVARAVAGASGEVPAVTESDNGKVLKAIYDEGGAAVEWGDAAPAVTVDQTYNALSENPQSGTAVSGAIATIKQVPASTASDSSKVLTVNASGNPEWQTAQGGGSSYTAGDGIDITNNEISVNADDETLDFTPVTIQSTSSSSTWQYGVVSATTDVINALNSQTPVKVKIHLPFRAVDWWNNLPSTATFRIAVTSNEAYNYAYDGAAVEMYESGGMYLNEAQDITVIGPATSWAYSGGSGSWSGITGIRIAAVDGGSIIGYCDTFNAGEVTYTVTRTDPNKNMLTVKNPLPASTSTDANKVLTVNSNGAAGWQPVDEVPDVTSSDAGKVLTASYSGGTGSYSWQTGVQVVANETFTTKSNNIYTYTVANAGLYSVTITVGAVSMLDAPARVTIGSGEYVYKNEELASSGGDVNVSLIRRISANTQLDFKFYDGSSNLISSFFKTPQITLIKYA